jgi:hypothetical protein
VCQTRLVISAVGRPRGPAPPGHPFPLVPALTARAGRAPTGRPIVGRRVDRTVPTGRPTSSWGRARRALTASGRTALGSRTTVLWGPTGPCTAHPTSWTGSVRCSQYYCIMFF